MFTLQNVHFLGHKIWKGDNVLKYDEMGAWGTKGWNHGAKLCSPGLYYGDKLTVISE